MAIFRNKNDEEFKNYGPDREQHVLIPTEWAVGTDKRDEDLTWTNRYIYEADIISSIIKDNSFSKVLELGSGPGKLSQIIQKNNPSVEYHLVDKINAYKTFEQNNCKGKFFVLDLFNGFDTSQLDKDYDLIIANDFLEHIANPSDILYNSRSITEDNGRLFVSVPNWRMGHKFIYRSLFDYDNWIYFNFIHGWHVEDVYPSPLKCSHEPKLDSEQAMDDSLITSWNWYFCSNKIL